jgi:hypothetical protein
MIRLLSLAALLFSTSAIAHPAMDAIKAIDVDPLDKLPHRIVRTTTTDKKVSTEIAYYNPAAPEGKRWTLESVDGHAPTDKQTAKFLKTKAEPKEPALSTQIDPASLTAIDDGAQPRRWRFRFRRGLEIQGFELDKFSGQVSLNEAGELAAVDVRLDQPTRIKMVLKLSQMVNHTEYVKLPSGGTAQKLADTHMTATAVGISMNHVSRTKFELVGARHGG